MFSCCKVYFMSKNIVYCNCIFKKFIVNYNVEGGESYVDVLIIGL